MRSLTVDEVGIVSVCAVGSYNGRVFYDKEVSFILGEGSEVTINNVL